MAKNGSKGQEAKARKKVAKAQNRYMKAVAKGERQMRSIRAEVDEQIARAKAEFERVAGELAHIESRKKTKPATAGPEQAAEAVQEVAAENAPADSDVVVPNGVPTEAPIKATPSRSSKSRAVSKKNSATK